MNEPSETPYAMWLTDFCSDDVEHNVKTEADFSTSSITADRIGTWASITADRIGNWHCGGIISAPTSFTAEKIKCGTVSTVPSLLGVGLTLKTELEKARARIAELEGQLSTAQQRIAALEAKPVEVVGDLDWTMPRSLLPRGL
jgi:hypothetical protein